MPTSLLVAFLPNLTERRYREARNRHHQNMNTADRSSIATAAVIAFANFFLLVNLNLWCRRRFSIIAIPSVIRSDLPAKVEKNEKKQRNKKKLQR